MYFLPSRYLHSNLAEMNTTTNADASPIETATLMHISVSKHRKSAQAYIEVISDKIGINK